MGFILRRFWHKRNRILTIPLLTFTPGEILNKLKSKGLLASSVSTYDFSTLYTTLPHNLIKEKLVK